jgi:uncharacterized protein
MENQQLFTLIQSVCQKIAPAWPLRNTIAVNPFLGFSNTRFEIASALLHENGQMQTTMPLTFYLEQCKEGNIDSSLLQKEVQLMLGGLSIQDFLENATKYQFEMASELKIPLVINVINDCSKLNLLEFLVDSVSQWTALFYDETRVFWRKVYPNKNLFDCWKFDAEIDLSPEFMGAHNFRQILKSLPNHEDDAIEKILQELPIPPEFLESYLHGLLLRVVGWSSFISGIDWDMNLYSEKTTNLKSFLAIQLAWEYCFFHSFKDLKIENKWKASWGQFKNRKEDTVLLYRTIFQNVYDKTAQYRLIEKIEKSSSNAPKKTIPLAQVVFCIDVRSEIYRRNLEKVNNEIETIGFAGFFGFPIRFFKPAQNEGQNLCPALLPSSLVVREEGKNQQSSLQAKNKTIVRNQFFKSWKRFKSGVVSAFSFVSPMGIYFLPKLVFNSYGWTRPAISQKSKDVVEYKKGTKHIDISSIDLDTQVATALGALKTMGLISNFAQVVLISGHQATTTNNPHDSGLDCGACGGHSGLINAITATKILNQIEIRERLTAFQIFIPKETIFLACIHNTTTDKIDVMESMIPERVDRERLQLIYTSLEQATALSQMERASRLGITQNIAKSIQYRTIDWSQVRPEWGLSGCSSFIIAPRHRSENVDLQGHTFLHSYDWKKDPDFTILETIITAPMLVTSWINLFYYGSITDPEKLGAGNKTLHNVLGGVGVFEGAAGDLKIGLPMQSVHNGKNLEHLPRRLTVIIDAPIYAIETILNNHPNVRDLITNSWISLYAMNEDGKIHKRYSENKKFVDFKKK